LSSLRKKTWDDFTNYLREQWTGFPPEIQEGASRVYRRVGPVANKTAQYYANSGKEQGKRAIMENLKKVPLRTPYTGPNAFKPKPKPDPNKRKGSWWDIVLSPKEQDDIKAAREKLRNGYNSVTDTSTVNQTVVVNKPTRKSSKNVAVSKSSIPSYLQPDDKKKVKK
jgi:hypothetical protein